MISTIGTTTDGKRVVAGVFRFYETHGMPLDSLLDVLRERDCVPAWPLLLQEMTAAGMKRDRALAKIGEAIGDTFGSDFRDVVIGRLEAA